VIVDVIGRGLVVQTMRSVETLLRRFDARGLVGASFFSGGC